MEFQNGESSPIVTIHGSEQEQFTKISIIEEIRFISIGMRNDLTYTGIRLYDENQEVIHSLWNVKGAADT